MRRNCLSFLISGLFLMMLFSGYRAPEVSLFPVTVSLKGKMLSVGENLGKLHSIEAVDDYLILTDNHKSTLYTILKTDGSYCFHFGRKGKGPGEMLQASGVKMIRNGHLILSDGYKLYRHCLDSLYQSIDHPIPTRQPEIGDTHIWVADLSDSLFVATGLFSNGKRFKFIDYSGTSLAYIGDYPLEKETDLPFNVIGSAFMSIMTSHPTANRFAVGTNYGAMLDVLAWDLQDLSLERIGGICEYKPQVTSRSYQGTPNFVPNEKTRWGYINMDSDSDYIYALYSGRFQREGMPYWLGNTIHVFDWDGNPVCRINLDKDVRDIAVVQGKLYAMYEDAEIGYQIIEYVLPDKFSGKNKK